MRLLKAFINNVLIGILTLQEKEFSIYSQFYGALLFTL